MDLLEDGGVGGGVGNAPADGELSGPHAGLGAGAAALKRTRRRDNSASIMGAERDGFTRGRAALIYGV